MRLFCISCLFSLRRYITKHLRPYSKSSLTLTLNEWRFNLSDSLVSMLFLNSWRVSVIPYYVTTHPPAIQKQHWHWKETQIEPPLIECKCEWAFRIRALISAVLLGKSLFCFSNENSMNLNVSLHFVSEENRKVLNHSSSGWVEVGAPRHQPLSVPDLLVIII